jgi:predicted nuclease of restriction endonuclease-like (RecB) superfamily
VAPKGSSQKAIIPIEGYDSIVSELIDFIDGARRVSARSVNAVMTATYWEIGRRMVKFEQKGKERAAYGESLLDRLATDLTHRFGRGFGRANLAQMRKFFLTWPNIVQTVSGQLGGGQSGSNLQRIPEGPGETHPLLALPLVKSRFPLPWSHYVRLMALRSEESRRFYETEALRCGWSFRQLDRQISSQFYERTALSRNKAAMLKKAGKAEPGDLLTPEEEIKDPFVLEFLGLKDEYSEAELEEALILHLEAFLLELGGDFAFIARQRRLRIDDEWYRIDLLFFHRKLRSLIICDLKLTRFTPADAGQMNLYLNYAKEHWMNEGENPPVGVILCAQKGEAAAHYALAGLANKVLPREYTTVLPSEKLLVQEIEKVRNELTKREKWPKR